MKFTLTAELFAACRTLELLIRLGAVGTYFVVSEIYDEKDVNFHLRLTNC
jgi:hypothetical protein